MVSRRAFSLIELLAVIAIAALLSALILSAVHGSKARIKDVTCSSQLKQIGIASVMFDEEEGKYPAAKMPNTNRFLSPLQPLLPIIRDARVFLCPTDINRIPSASLNLLNRSNTSYFVSYTARKDEPEAILAGDRNVTWDGALMTGANQFRRTNGFGWWRDMHRWKGNVLLSDASVHLTPTKQLAARIHNQRTPTFDWYIPNGDVVITPSD
jgi:prepilin-type N-terminal cleavage/methylation domain-containing protein